MFNSIAFYQEIVKLDPEISDECKLYNRVNGEFIYEGATVWPVLIATLAMTLLCFISLMMNNSKILMAHPNKLTFYTCLAEACACWHCMVELIGSTEFICYLRLDDLFRTLLWQNTTEGTA
jgi:hypothetical protein